MSEIQQAKDNCLEAGSSSVCRVNGSRPGGEKSKRGPCHKCNTMDHSEQGYDDKVRKHFAKHTRQSVKNV